MSGSLVKAEMTSAICLISSTDCTLHAEISYLTVLSSVMIVSLQKHIANRCNTLDCTTDSSYVPMNGNAISECSTTINLILEKYVELQ